MSLDGPDVMSHAELADLLGAYALDAVDDDEGALVEDHLRDCPRCRAEMEEHRQVASLLAQSGGAAPEGLWERIAGSLEEAPPGLRLVPAVTQPAAALAAVPRRPSRFATAVLVAAAAVVVVLGVQVSQQDRRIDELQTALQDPLAPAFQQALEAPDSTIVELASADGEVQIRGAVTRDGLGYLQASGLPRLGGGRTYQLWGAAGDQLVSLGVLGPEPGIVTFQAEAYQAFAVSEEDAPGVVVSRNPPVVVGSAA